MTFGEMSFINIVTIFIFFSSFTFLIKKKTIFAAELGKQSRSFIVVVQILCFLKSKVTFLNPQRCSLLPCHLMSKVTCLCFFILIFSFSNRTEESNAV